MQTGAGIGASWDWMSWIPQLLCYALWLGAVFALAEGLRRRQVGGEIVRKVIHIGVGNIILLAWWLQVPRWLGVGFALVFSVVALASYWVNVIPSLNSVGRQSIGTFFYALSIGVLLFWFWYPDLSWQPFAVVGTLVMTWGDALAALVGQQWGSHRYQIGQIHKSWEGSLTMWAVSSLVVMAVVGLRFGLTWEHLGMAIAIGWVATLLEIFSWWGLDNLTVPLASGGISYWLLKGSL